ncbi:MAG: hypothetical protein U5L76_01695 [Patescibacteria group bacterium]|nr:hypothetical protein [Patescibacteria group bacterium]
MLIKELRDLYGPIFIVTHGKTVIGQPDPWHSEQGKEKILKIQDYLPANSINNVITGLGQRHIEIAGFLGLKINFFNHLLGDGTKLDDSDHRYIYLTSGAKVRREQLGRVGMREGLIALFKSLSPNTLVCTGRPVIHYLGQEAYSTSLYLMEKGQLIKKVSFGDSWTE